MNLPNKITVARIFSAPLFYAGFLFSLSEMGNRVALPLFIGLGIFWLILEISDIADGCIARKRGLVSDLGKLMDPFSDVLSRLTFFYCFAITGIYSFWPILIIFWRELSITFIRAVMAQAGVTLPASSSGKLKAVFYFIASAYGMVISILMSARILTPVTLNWVIGIGYHLMILTMVVSVLSFIPYFVNFIKSDYMQKSIKE